MARKQSTILDSIDSSNYWFVIQWINRRFDEEERDPNNYVMSEPVGLAIDAGLPTAEVHSQVTASWRVLRKLWADGWDKEYNNKLPNVDEYFDNLVTLTNKWLDEHFPAYTGTGVAGRERKRLLAAVRQQRLREKRKGMSGNGAIQVSITGDLYQLLYRHWEIPEAKRHDVVRSALSIILESPELLIRAKQMSGVT